MRHFYIFNIDINFKKTIKLNDYFLYKMFDELHNISSENMCYGLNIYNNITKPINKKYINDKLFRCYKNNLHYVKFMNKHMYNNYFNNESSMLTVKNSYIELNSTSINPIFFKSLYKYKNLFVCDFENKDYFWIESIA